MSPRGRIPYRTVYAYPPSEFFPSGLTGRTPAREECTARSLAVKVARRGGIAKVVRIADDGVESVLATVTPDDVEDEA